MAQDMLELELDKLENRGISRYKAVLMAAQEARFLNDQIKLNIIDTKEKPSSLALKWLFEGRVVENEEHKVEG
ncbi:MAG: DNA-directed RNA polymerase subunit omega [Chitinispirillaceae bacterium]|nr:DNA-directed RNA polymerase subunit omega [Chitinispirillaceae bacterium]